MIHETTERKRAKKAAAHLPLHKQQARAELERANAAKDQFLLMVVHELRNPLNSIMTWTQVLRSAMLSESDVSQGVQSIEHSARTLSKLVEDLLDISRIGTGNLRLELCETSVAALVQIAADAARPLAEAKGLRLELEIDHSVGTVLGDSHRLEQVAWNLIMNAIKFTPRDGRIVLGVDTIGAMCRLTVSDTGKGIEADLLPHIFDPFWQAAGPTSQRAGGLGLGLAIARRLVEMHGGQIQAESAGEGKGAKLTLLLPLLARGDLGAVSPRSSSLVEGRERSPMAGIAPAP